MYGFDLTSLWASIYCDVRFENTIIQQNPIYAVFDLKATILLAENNKTSDIGTVP